MSELLEGYKNLKAVLDALDEQSPYLVLFVTPVKGGYAIGVDWRDYSSWRPAVDYCGTVSTRSGVHVEAYTDYTLFVPV